MCVETIKKWEWCQRSVGSVRVHGPYSEHVINPGVFRPDVPDVNNLYYISGPRILVVSQTVNFSLSIMFPHWKHIHQHIFGTRYASVLRLGTYFWATRIHLRQLPLMEFLRCNCWMENGYMFSRVAHSTFDWLMTVNFRWCLTTTFQTVSLIFIPVEKSECGKGWSKGIRLLSVIQLLLQGRTDKQNPFSVILSDPLLHWVFWSTILQVQSLPYLS